MGSSVECVADMEAIPFCIKDGIGGITDAVKTMFKQEPQKVNKQN